MDVHFETEWYSGTFLVEAIRLRFFNRYPLLLRTHSVSDGRMNRHGALL